MPTVSVIVPIYNSEQYLERCLGSLAEQNCLDYEVLCIDDSSTDNSFKIIERFQSQYPEIFKAYRNTYNVGQGSTREKGIELASGEYILFVDSDDYISNDYISSYLTIASSDSSIDVVIGGCIEEGDSQVKRYPSNTVWSLAIWAVAWAKLYKREFLVTHGIGFSKVRRGEDIHFALSCFCEDPVFRVIQYCGYHYCFNSDSTMRSICSNDRFEEDINLLFEEFRKVYPDTQLPQYKNEIIDYSYIVNMISPLLLYGRGCGVSAMIQRYNYVFSNLSRKCKTLQNNPYLKLRNTKGQTMRMRLSTWLLLKMRRWHIDIIIYLTIAILPSRR